MQRVITNDIQRQNLLTLIQNREMPFTVKIEKGRKRSVEQNRLQRMWMLELQEQGDMTAEEYRGYCKLWFGVGIVKAHNDEFAEKYDKTIKGLSYEQKLMCMQEPLDFPVTRLMTTRQKAEYLDQIYVHFTKQGFHLTEPNQPARRAA